MLVNIDADKLYSVLDESLEEFTREFSLMCRKVIEEDRLWEGWETSNPLRDIVDTNAMNESIEVYKDRLLSYYVSWATDYVLYVYFGYALPSGQRIPPRRWAEIAVDENEVLEIFGDILRKRLS